MRLQFHGAWILLASITTTASVHAASMQTRPHDVQPESRIQVAFPPLLKHRVLASMRMHLQGMAGIQRALANGRFEKAAEIATVTLGMSSMHGNQMAREAKYMPPGMQKMGAQMHERATEFAISAQNAAATGDIRQPLRALSRVTQSCVACHSVYRLK